MPLPTTKTPPKIDMSRLRMMLFGLPKIGKSTFCSKFPDALFLPTERGLDSLEVYQHPIDKWSDLTVALDLLEKPTQFKTVILDTVDNAYKMCVDHFIAENKVKWLGDLAFGKGTALVTGEFDRMLRRLAALPCGIILVSHARKKIVEGDTGEVETATPTLHEKAREVVLGMADMVLYVDQEHVKMDDGKRVLRSVLRTKRSKSYEAGDRTGRLPETLPLDFDTFAAAFQTAKKEITKPATKPALTAPAA